MDKYLFTFPEKWQLNLGSSIDDWIKALSREHRDVLSAIKSIIIDAINGINWILSIIPWWLLIIIVIILGYKVRGKKSTGILYGLMLFTVGWFGFWPHMLETLSIVIASVFLSVLIGFPLGVLIAMKKWAHNAIRPILDLMQTMPAFVYLVPAVILFSTGKTPALMATTIYSIVPMIRMTSLGISSVDAEVVEAAKSFGSTTIQTLVKVQIPQAKSTIMTGVNQTIMMAMSMVVTCALIGADGLGMEILLATNRTEMGKALLPGIVIVIIAIILDRLTQGFIGEDDLIEE